MIEVFTYIAKKIGDALLGDAIKSLRDKPKKVGKCLIDSHSRLADLEETLDDLLVALSAARRRLDGATPLVPFDKLAYPFDRDVNFFESDDMLAGMDIRHSGWSRIANTNDFEPTFSRTDGSEVDYQSFLSEFIDYAVRNSYRAMQRAAICLRNNLTMISEELLSVADPKLLAILDILAKDDARFASWIFNSAPKFAFDPSANQIKMSLTTFSDSDLAVVRRVGPEFEKAAELGEDVAGTTDFSLASEKDVRKATAVVQTLSEQIKLAKDATAEFVRENWKLSDLL